MSGGIRASKTVAGCPLFRTRLISWPIASWRTGADAMITGDMIHSPLQGKYPDLGMMSDYDSAQAGATRRAVFDRFCDEPTIMCVTHFPSPSRVRVRRWAEG